MRGTAEHRAVRLRSARTRPRAASLTAFQRDQPARLCHRPARRWSSRCRSRCRRLSGSWARLQETGGTGSARGAADVKCSGAAKVQRLGPGAIFEPSLNRAEAEARQIMAHRPAGHQIGHHPAHAGADAEAMAAHPRGDGQARQCGAWSTTGTTSGMVSIIPAQAAFSLGRPSAGKARGEGCPAPGQRGHVGRGVQDADAARTG